MSKDIKKTLIDFCEKVIKGERKIEDISQIFTLVEYADLEIKLAYSSLVKSSLDIAISEYAEDILGFDRAIKHYEMVKTAYLLDVYLGTNIILDIDDEKVYDLIQKSGLIVYLTKFTKGDYYDFEKFMDRFSGIENIALIYEIRTLTNSLPTMQDLSEATKSLNSFTSEDIKNLGNIVKYNDPTVVEVAKTIKTNPLEFADAIAKQEESETKGENFK